MYLADLTKDQLQEQIIDLYGRFKDVKEFYDFAFNPREEKLLEECKFKIAKEYFPVNGRKAKARRSVAQKIIRHFQRLGVDAPLIADVMLYNIEMAQTYSSQHEIKQTAFYVSMLKSFEEVVGFISEHGMLNDLQPRVERITQEAWNQNWINKGAFEKISSAMIS